ncbi:hypothetical protein WJX82_000684 [Trebouxia sp. C0006]
MATLSLLAAVTTDCRWPIKPLGPPREACWWLRGDEQSSLLVNDCVVALVDQAYLQKLSREFLLSGI